MIPLTVEQENEIDTAWFALAKEHLGQFFGQPINQRTLGAMNAIAKYIGRELSEQFHQYLMSDDQIEVTIGIDENFGLVAGWRPAKILPPEPLIDEIEAFTEEPL